MSTEQLGCVIYIGIAQGDTVESTISGYVLRGYFYSLNPDPTKKIPIKARDNPTNQGFLLKEDLDKSGVIPVKIIKYLDVLRSGLETKDWTETGLLAIDEIIKIVTEEDVKQLTIINDDHKLRTGLKSQYKTWQKLGWVTKSGGDIPHLNIWKAWARLEQEVLDKQAMVIDYFLDVKLPSLSYINKNLLRVKRLLVKNITHHETYITNNSSVLESGKLEPPRLLMHSKLYFVSNGESKQTRWNKNIYHLGDHKDRDELLGKRASDHSFAVIATTERDPVIDFLIDKHNDVTDHDNITVCWCLLNRALVKSTYNELFEKQDLYLNRAQHQNQLINFDSNVVTAEANPPYLSYRAIDVLNTLEDILGEYIKHREGNKSDWKNIQFYDITDLFMDGDKLRKEIAQTTRFIDAKITHQDKPLTLRLNVGDDTPKYNSMVSLARHIRHVCLVTMAESPHLVSYYTVFDFGDNLGIYSSVYASKKIITN